MGPLKLWVLPIFWVACFAAGYVYTRPRGVPLDVLLWVAPAFLLEATLFLSMGVERWRKRVERLPKRVIAGLLIVGAVAPWWLAVEPFGNFSWTGLVVIGAMGAVASLWYLFLPAHPASDLALLTFMAAVMLMKPFEAFYVRPAPGLALASLGQAMWIRTGLYAMLSVRGVKGVGFGFWPSAREWKIGGAHFAAMLPVVVALGWWTGFALPQAPVGGPVDVAEMLVLTFFGALWVLALGEEFFFRGLLQQWLSGWMGSRGMGLAVTSVLFGSVHLFYQAFPNWRFALLATVAGVFYGMAFNRAGSIRASMVTHAATVTAWKIFFGG